MRTDMGICLNLSGTGCRAFESYGHGDWFKLLSLYFTLRDHGVREKKGRFYSYNITRLDLAYDDHTGVLDIYRIEEDLKSRYYTAKAKFAESTWSDDQEKDIQGLSVYVGAKSSDIRAITDRVYYVRKHFFTGFWITCCYRVPYDILFPDPKRGNEKLGEIVQGYCKPSFLNRLFARRIWRPKYYRYFDSWELSPLPPLPVSYLPFSPSSSSDCPYSCTETKGLFCCVR